MEELVDRQEYPEAVVDLQAAHPNVPFVRKTIEVRNERDTVVLTIGSQPLYLTSRQALDLSYALSKHAKRISKKRKKQSEFPKDAPKDLGGLLNTLLESDR